MYQTTSYFHEGGRPKDAEKRGWLPHQVDWDVRISFAIRWFDSEEAADAYAETVRKQGRTYNGGYMHGAGLGRDKSWDRAVNGVPCYAVTD